MDFIIMHWMRDWFLINAIISARKSINQEEKQYKEFL